MRYKGAVRSAHGRLVELGLLALLLSSCSASTQTALGPGDAPQQADSPLVAAQPGAWFDGDGNLSVVSAGRRLRLVLSAPIAACTSAFDSGARGADLAQKASLPFRVLSEACRHDHPTILLPEESETASPSELERSYHDVFSCAAHDLSADGAWAPSAIADADPCPLVLGLGWRLPDVSQLEGLGIDERKAVAGALFDMEDRGGFGSLLLYARATDGSLQLVTLSPNSSERAPQLDPEQRSRPLAGAALRCVRDGQPASSSARPTPPPLPEAAACLSTLRSEQAKLKAPASAPPIELERLDAWLKRFAKAPVLLNTEAAQRDLLQLLSAPALDTLAREAREERALTERYAELAEALDDPAASPGERQRRQAEFDTLRKRLSGQIGALAIASSANRRLLSTLLTRVEDALNQVEKARKSPQKGKHVVDPAPIWRRVRELQGQSPAPSAPAAKPAAKH